MFRTLIRAKFSPQASTGQKYIYSGSSDGCVYIWDTLTGEIVACLNDEVHVRKPPSCVFFLLKHLQGSIVRDVSWHPTLPVLCSSSVPFSFLLFSELSDYLLKWDGYVGVWDYRGEDTPVITYRDGRSRLRRLY